jgi:ubiquinone biosynthesis protein
VFARHSIETLAGLLCEPLPSNHKKEPGRRGADHLRDAFLELGPTFIKLGQVLSTRPDLVPPTYEEALSSLQDSALPVPFSILREAISEELCRDPAEAYAHLEEEPMAAASIGQVHAARLFDGRQVVVKVRRPGIIAAVDSDLAIFQRLVKLGALAWGPLRRVDLVGFADEFALSLRSELDYVAEGGNADRIRPSLSALGVHVPEVVWELTTPGVLTLERIYGTKITDLVTLEELGVDLSEIARKLVYAYLTMVFVDGFFHADPHPGNFFVEDDGRLAMVDFGMMGTVSASVRTALMEILFSLAAKDMMRSAAALKSLGIVPGDIDEAGLAAELEPLAAASFDLPIGEMRIAPLLGDLMAVSRRHRLRFPHELGLLVKTIVMCEGLAVRLDPTFSLPPLLAQFIQSSFPSVFGAQTQS